MTTARSERSALVGWRKRVHEVIFEAETRAGRTFDVGLLLAIAISLIAVSLETVEEIANPYRTALWSVELALTAIFTLEYGLRLSSVREPWRYATSFFGIVDLLSILPTYLSFFVPGMQSLLVIRSLRLLRIFRVLKLAHFVADADLLMSALRSSRNKIIVFVGAVLTIVTIMGTLMYLIEGEAHGFDSIPRSMYWAVVTMTTVGFGDITPQTVAGRFVASILMLVGYGMLAVPTGVFSAELVAAARDRPVTTRACPTCSGEGHDPDADFCKFCGGAMA